MRLLPPCDCACECPTCFPNRRHGEPTLLEAVHDLHRQAHPTQPADVVLCKAEPCRSLRFDTLTGAA
jgi:hypothetical protein